MLGRYPNLWVETAIRGDIVAGGRVPPDWRQLFIDFPDRFMIGTDSYIVPRWTAMPEILAEVRAALLTLPPDLAEALAWRNAARLYGVDAAAFRAAGD
jgi:predicted TIM-barrel fold metal-dependent hydrolase